MNTLWHNNVTKFFTILVYKVIKQMAYEYNIQLSGQFN
jgi:hypothetical protein